VTAHDPGQVAETNEGPGGTDTAELSGDLTLWYLTFVILRELYSK
jgi:hypothetical protein